MAGRIPARWIALSIFTLATALSFLDRQVLAALAPEIQEEFGLNNKQYGYLLSVFSILYAGGAPMLGLFIDRAGLNIGISLSVGVWSLAGMATGFAGGYAGLLGCRAALGLAESGGIPANGKAVATYLLPRERALGAGLGQIGISLGMVTAPVLASGLAVAYGWRSAFVVTGALGFLWIPLWLWTSRALPADAVEPAPAPKLAAMVGDPRLWALVAANILGMTVYSLWINWTTVFLVNTQGLTPQDANQRLAWIPPLFAALGGLAGGWLSMRLARAGWDLLDARRRVCLLSTLALLVTAAVPHIPSAALATAAICWSFFWAVAFSVNLYAMPIDMFGAERAAFGVSALTCAYGFMQTFLSPLIGDGIDRAGFGPVCGVVAVLPLAAVAILYFARRKR